MGEAGGGLRYPDSAAEDALEKWREGGSYRGFSDVAGQEHEDAGFLAGFEKGVEFIRDRVLAVWDMSGAWVPGGRSATLAEALGVPKGRTLSHWHGGQSNPDDAKSFEWLNG